jgi:hypothetical protein
VAMLLKKMVKIKKIFEVKMILSFEEEKERSLSISYDQLKRKYAL